MDTCVKNGGEFSSSHPSAVYWPEFPVPGTPVPGNSSFFFDGIGTGIKKNWYRKKSRNRSQKILVPKKISESVSKKFGIEEKYRNQSRNISEY